MRRSIDHPDRRKGIYSQPGIPRLSLHAAACWRWTPREFRREERIEHSGECGVCCAIKAIEQAMTNILPMQICSWRTAEQSIVAGVMKKWFAREHWLRLAPADKGLQDLADHIRLLGARRGESLEISWSRPATHAYRSYCTPTRKGRRSPRALGTSTTLFSRRGGPFQMATLPSADIVLICIVGTSGLQPAAGGHSRGTKKDLPGPRRKSSSWRGKL